MGFRDVDVAYPVPSRIERALDLVFPPICVGCHRVGRWICPRCWPHVPWLADAVRVPPGAGVDDVFAAVAFDGIGQEAVYALKFHERHAIASLLGRLMTGRITGRRPDIVAPVSLHRRRRRERGYDQAHLLARVVARETQIRYRKRLLRRVRYTTQQATLDAATRHRNLAGAFAATEQLGGEHVVLVDDVYTTGATMAAAAEALRAAGAGRVSALVFARAVNSAGRTPELSLTESTSTAK